MKHTKQIILLLALMSALAIFVGCDDTTTQKMASADALNGTYQLIDASGNATEGVSMIFNNEDNTLFYCGDYTYEFEASGDATVVTMTAELYGMSLTYSTEKDDDGNVVMTPDVSNLNFNDGYTAEDYVKTLTLKEGTDGLMGDTLFDGTYSYTDNELGTIQFTSDGVWREGYMYNYSIDSGNGFNIDGYTTDYTYDRNDDGSEVTIYDDEGDPMYMLRRVEE
jgi:hypothetical protein